MRCRVCSSAKRSAIEAATELRTIADVAAQFGLSETTLKKHLTAHARAAAPEVPPETSPPPERPRVPSTATIDEEPPATSRSRDLDEIVAPRDSESRVRVDSDEVDELMREIRLHLQIARTDVAATYQAKSALIGKALSAIRLKKQLTGELGQTEAAVLASPRVRRLLKEILDALKPYPDAARAVLARIEGTEAA